MDKLTVYAFVPRALRNNPGLKPSWRFIIFKGKAVVWDKENEEIQATGWEKKVDNNCRETTEALPKRLVMSRRLYHNVSGDTREILQTLNVTIV